MDRSDIRDEIRIITKTNELNISDTEMNSLIDQGYYAVCAAFQWDWLVRRTAINSVADDPNLSPLPTDIGAVLSISHAIDNEETLTPVSLFSLHAAYGADQNDWDTDDYAEYYAMEYATGTGTPEIILYPVPNQITSYVIWYTAAPTLMTLDTHTPEWSILFHHILVDYVAYKIYEREEAYRQSELAFARFQRTLLDMKRWYQTNRSKPFPVIIGGSRDVIFDPRQNLPFD